MKISFIGAGNASWNLALSLFEAGNEIVCISNRTEEKAKELALLTNASFTTELTNEVFQKSDVIIVSTRDDGYKDVAAKLRTNIPVVHTSGSVPSDVLADCSPHYGVFYPLQSMLKIRRTDFSTVPFCLEANHPTLMETLQKLAFQLSSNVYEMDSEARRKVHLAAIFVSNFSNYLYSLSEEFLAQEKLPPKLLVPLIEETALRLRVSPAASLQTGPAKRNDTSVINKHLSMLEQSPDMLKVYALMSELIRKKYHA